MLIMMETALSSFAIDCIKNNPLKGIHLGIVMMLAEQSML